MRAVLWTPAECAHRQPGPGVASKRTTPVEKLVPQAPPRQTFFMRSLSSLLVGVILVAGVYVFYLKKMPSTDDGTAPTQFISLTGVRSDLLQIARAERTNMALSRCLPLDELISSGGLSLQRTERDGYTYKVNCSGMDFQVVAQHPPAPQGSPVRFPVLVIDSTMKIQELPAN